MHDFNRPAYRAEITNHDGHLVVALFAGERLFSRQFRKICDAERWLTSLARRGLTVRAIPHVNGEGRHLRVMPPFGAIAVADARVRKQAILPAVFT
jgi:hypothetical protein